MAVVEVSDDRLNSRELRDASRPLCISLAIAPISCVERIPDFNTWLGSRLPAGAVPWNLVVRFWCLDPSSVLSRKFGYHERNSGRSILLSQARNSKGFECEPF